jgi:glycosyltransferase involved in cell wall biosynthesis
MRVLLVTGLTHYGHGGVQRETVALVKSLVQRGVDVGVMSDTFPIIEGLHHFPTVYPPDDRVGEKLSRVVSDFRPDLIHVVGGGVNMLRRIDRSSPIVPWLVTIHNVPPFERGSAYFSGCNGLYYAVRDAAGIPSNLVWRRFLSWARFARVICHSEMVGKRVRASGCHPAKIVEIPLGCDFEPQAIQVDAQEQAPFPDGAHPRILSIGGLIHHKGFHDFLPVAARLLPDWPRLHYCVLGETRGWPKYQERLLEVAERSGMKDHFSLLLNASEPQRRNALADSDIYVQPSHEEGFCLSFLEAAAIIPHVIGTRTGAIESIARNFAGMRVIRAKSQRDLEAASRELLSQPAAHLDLPARQKALKDRFSWENHAKLHMDLYAVAARGK